MNDKSYIFYESVFKQLEILKKRLGKETAYDFIEAISRFELYGE